MAAGTVIVGGGVGGLRCAERLRRAGYADPIRIVSAEGGLPYDRPHLSKEAITGEAPPEPQRLTTEEKLAAAGIELVPGRAVALDAANRSVDLADGARIAYDYLVVATGAEPRRIPILGDAANVHVLRTWADAMRLRKAVRGGGRVVVVGAGVLGLEVAASARVLGCEVEVVDLAPAPVSRLGGPDFGEAVAELHRSHGVSLRLGVSIEGAETVDGSVRSIVLGDGTVLPADTVVVAVGAAPDTAWLDGNGLLVDGVLRGDERCRTADARIYAIGDAAAVKRSHGAHERHEHFTNAVDTAALAAAGIAEQALGEPQRTLDELPYFWSDQYGVKIQILGVVNPGEPLRTVVEDGETGQRLQLSSRDGAVTAVVGWNMPAALNRCRLPLMRGVATDDLVSAAPWVRSGS